MARANDKQHNLSINHKEVFPYDQTVCWGKSLLIILCFLVLFGSAIRISRKGWHMLLNFCFHTALTFAVFAGGINRIKYPIICQAVSAFPFHLSCSQSFSENWLWMSIQVPAARALSAICGPNPARPTHALDIFHASTACMARSFILRCWHSEPWCFKHSLPATLLVVCPSCCQRLVVRSLAWIIPQ